MPQQEVFFEQITGERRIQVLKTYDPSYAREVFDEMDDDAQAVLWKSLDIERTYARRRPALLHRPGPRGFLVGRADGFREGGRSAKSQPAVDFSW